MQVRFNVVLLQGLGVRFRILRGVGVKVRLGLGRIYFCFVYSYTTDVKKQLRLHPQRRMKSVQ